MSNIHNISIVLTFLALWMSNFFDKRMETTVALILIFSIGIIHGSNDIQIIQKVQTRQKSFLRLLGVYVVTVILAAILFYVLPQLALAIFILISAYHFGEQHFHGLKINSPADKTLFFGCYGLTLLLMLLYCHWQMAAEVIEQISGLKMESDYFLYGFVGSSVAMLLLGFYLVYSRVLKSWYKELFYLLVLFIIFKSASLIWGFAIYFVIWHSLPSMLDQVKFLNGAISKKSIWSYVKSSLVYWLMAMAGMAVFFYVFKDQDQLFLTLFFTFLAAITFPHVLVMHKLFDH
ncbi:Brp/Blh family beta-carotene 15,15'-dioxygenase [Winogradskyella aurantiaca]|uniref:Brp/Blh family beta-carotene 15,15'-dioxygenase n=1 Tax=Winogradskyella aurantiaca TaxID=2219558 RepID=UPI000E1D357A|nr:Brp/Blh family beta-carotene 15,15'-dioxygenase [Winogradskyella aurantiaca]